jgi:hypothetical protein
VQRKIDEVFLRGCRKTNACKVRMGRTRPNDQPRLGHIEGVGLNHPPDWRGRVAPRFRSYQSHRNCDRYSTQHMCPDESGGPVEWRQRSDLIRTSNGVLETSERANGSVSMGSRNAVRLAPTKRHSIPPPCTRWHYIEDGSTDFQRETRAGPIRPERLFDEVHYLSKKLRTDRELNRSFEAVVVVPPESAAAAASSFVPSMAFSTHQQWIICVTVKEIGSYRHSHASNAVHDNATTRPFTVICNFPQ